MSPTGQTTPISGNARKRDLWWQFTVRAVESRYRGSYLGMLWAVLNPMLMLSVYFVVFGLILAAGALAVAILFVIALVRVIDVYLPIHPHARSVWITYAGLGAIFVLAGAFSMRRRIAGPH